MVLVGIGYRCHTTKSSSSKGTDSKTLNDKKQHPSHLQSYTDTPELFVLDPVCPDAVSACCHERIRFKGAEFHNTNVVMAHMAYQKDGL